MDVVVVMEPDVADVGGGIPGIHGVDGFGELGAGGLVETARTCWARSTAARVGQVTVTRVIACDCV